METIPILEGESAKDFLREEMIVRIARRIKDEHRKYGNRNKDWATIAAHKIYASFIKEK